MIMIGNIGSLKDYDLNGVDEIWFIVRSLKNGLPSVKDDNGNPVDIYHVPQLSPSPELFHKYLQWKKDGEWTEETFQEKYVPQFLRELHGEEQRRFLNILYKRAQEKCILLLCFCPDETMCHRSVVLGVMQGIYMEKGINVRCEGDDFTNDDYSDYYEMYKKLDNKFIANMQRSEWIRMNTFYLLVAGSRGFNDYATLCRECDKVLSRQIEKGKKIVIIEGAARGADELAGRYAKERGYELCEMPANWDKLGKSAGYKRNESMHLKAAAPTGQNERGVICFWDGQSRGTRHNFMLAEDYKNPIRVYNYLVGQYYTQEKVHEIAEEVREESRKYRYI